MSIYSILFLVLAGIIFIIGGLIVSGIWNPLNVKKADGTKDQLSRKEKAVTASIFTSIVLMILGLFFVTKRDSLS